MERIPDGTIIMDSWKVLSLIGEGGSGFVYLVRNVRNGKEYALKVLSREAEAKYPHLRESFLQEAELERKIRSPHLLPVREVFPCGPEDRPCFLMKYVHGITLNERINSGTPVSFDFALRIAEETASALKKIHEAGYLHLDVKPQNILIEEDGEGKSYLFDLGAAQAAGQTPEKTENLRLGTPVYSSPEQCGKSGRLTEKSDLYSLGVCLYLMCAGRLPFLFGPADEVIARVLSEEPAPPKQFNPEIPDALNRLILRLMAKDPEKRFADAGEAEKAIHSFRMQLKKNGGKWKRLFLLIPLVLLAAGVPVLLHKTRIPRTEKEPAPVRQTAAKPVPVPPKPEEKSLPEEPVPVPAAEKPSVPPPPAQPVKRAEPPPIPSSPVPEKKSPAKPPEKKRVSRKKKRSRKQPEKKKSAVKAVLPETVPEKRPDVTKTVPAAVRKTVPEKPVKTVRKDPGEEIRKRLRNSRKIAPSEGMSAAALLAKAAAAAQIRLRYVDCPAQILTDSAPIRFSESVSAETAVRTVLKKIPKLHGIPMEQGVLLFYYGNQPRGRFPDLAVWEQNGQLLQRSASRKETEAAMDGIVLNRVQVSGMPLSFMLGLFRRNTGLTVRTDSLQLEKEVAFRADSITLRQFCRLICGKVQCEYRIEENGTVFFYRYLKRVFR